MQFYEIAEKQICKLAELYLQTFNAPPWNDHWTVGTAEKRLRQFAHSEGFYGLAAYCNKNLCAFILGNEQQYFNTVMFDIKEFCVKPEFQRQGVGTAVLCEFEQKLKEKGIGEVIIFTSKDVQAENFYKNRGYAPYERMVMMGKGL